MVWRIHIESDQDVWVATQVGLAHLRYSESGWTWRLYGDREGLASSEVRDVTYLRDTVWVATTGGLTAIPKANLLKPEPVPRIRLTGIHLKGEKIAPTDSLALGYGDRRLRVEFEALSFGTRGNVQYKYRMTGLDSTRRTRHLNSSPITANWTNPAMSQTHQSCHQGRATSTELEAGSDQGPTPLRAMISNRYRPGGREL